MLADPGISTAERMCSTAEPENSAKHADAPDRAAAPDAKRSETDELEGQLSAGLSGSASEDNGLIGELASAVELSQLSAWPGHEDDGVDDWEKVSASCWR